MGELEFQRKLNMSDSVTTATAEDSEPLMGERERAEGESADDSEPSDQEDVDSEEDDSEGKGGSEVIGF